VSREVAAAEMIAVTASRLEFLRAFFCGLTPAAIGCRRFATQRSATSKLTRRVTNLSRSELPPTLRPQIMIQRIMTAEEFADQKYDLPDGGRWSELIAGEPVILEQPSDDHGNVIRNLSRFLAQWIEDKQVGYACFELGIIVQRSPDTVVCPAVSYFVTGNRWDETDKVVTDTKPALVIDVASTVDRRRNMPARISHYRSLGIPVAIVIDPMEQKIAVHTGKDQVDVLGREESLTSKSDWIDDPSDGPLLAGLSIPVRDIFEQPEWWQWASRPE
jgi:Uma2 family endonuclease